MKTIAVLVGLVLSGSLLPPLATAQAPKVPRVGFLCAEWCPAFSERCPSRSSCGRTR